MTRGSDHTRPVMDRGGMYVETPFRQMVERRLSTDIFKGGVIHDIDDDTRTHENQERKVAFAKKANASLHSWFTKEKILFDQLIGSA